MKVISVINYKGGVGKTTLTANVGAELASRGYHVLMIDMDPQASLTFSFVRPEDWSRDLAKDRTIKEWYRSFDSGSVKALSDLRFTPAIQFVGGGTLDLIPSHLELINVDLELATELSGGTLRKAKLNYLRIHRRLADGLSEHNFADIDVVLIDCPPNFNIVTRSAIVASEYLLIPAKPDSLSTMGIDYLQRSLKELVGNYNDYARLDAADPEGHSISPQVLGVVFTMVQVYGGDPIASQRPFIAQARSLGLPVFKQWLRDNKSIYGPAAAEGLPVVVRPDTYAATVVAELEGMVDELVQRTSL